MMKTLNKICDVIQEIILGVIGICLLAIILVVCLQTFFRYVVFNSLPWSEELSRYLFVALILLGVSVSISRDSLVRMDLIDGALSQRAKSVLHIVRQVIALVISAGIAYESVGLLKLGAFRKSPAMQIPMHYVYSIVLIAFVLATFCAFVKLLNVLREEREKK